MTNRSATLPTRRQAALRTASLPLVFLLAPEHDRALARPAAGSRRVRDAADRRCRDVTRNELFLVEGDSAGGSAKEARDKETQAVLPLRGKVLNTMSKDSRTVLANKELQAIATAIGVDPHGLDDNPDLGSLRYGKVVVMTDADVDGGHIQALLLTFFFMHAPRLVERGHLYVAMPPLYKIEIPGQGKGKAVILHDRSCYNKLIIHLQDSPARPMTRQAMYSARGSLSSASGFSKSPGSSVCGRQPVDPEWVQDGDGAGV